MDNKKPTTTTLVALKESCKNSPSFLSILKELQEALNKRETNNEPIKISTIIEKTNLRFALLCLSSIPDCEELLRNLTADFTDRKFSYERKKLYPNNDYPEETERKAQDFIKDIREGNRGDIYKGAIACSDASVLARAAVWKGFSPANNIPIPIELRIALEAEDAWQSEQLIKYFG